MLLNVSSIVTKNEKGINGWMMPFVKTSEGFWDGYDIKYIYATSIDPGCRKGPILHLKRECRLCPIVGSCELVLKTGEGYNKILLDAGNPCVIPIKVGTEFCLYNQSQSICVLVNVANHCWTEDDQDSHKVIDWEFEI